MLTGAFWKAAGERAAKSFAQALLLLWVADGGLDMFAVNYQEALGLGLGAAVISLLTSVVSAPVGGNGGPSLANEVPK
jgi:hypothetical protein